MTYQELLELIKRDLEISLLMPEQVFVSIVECVDKHYQTESKQWSKEKAEAIYSFTYYVTYMLETFKITNPDQSKKLTGFIVQLFALIQNLENSSKTLEQDTTNILDETLDLGSELKKGVLLDVWQANMNEEEING